MYRGEDIAVLASALPSAASTRSGAAGALGARHRAIDPLPAQKTPLFGAISAGQPRAEPGACFVRAPFSIRCQPRVVRDPEDALRLSVPLTTSTPTSTCWPGSSDERRNCWRFRFSSFPFPPERVKRTSVGEGLRSLGDVDRGRTPRPSRSRPRPAPLPRTGVTTLSPRGGQPILIVPQPARAHAWRRAPEISFRERPADDRSADRSYRPHVSRIVLVVNPAFEAEARAGRAAGATCRRRRGPGAPDRHARRRAEGPRSSVARRRRASGSWCDQVAIHPRTIATLELSTKPRRADRHADAAAIQSVYSLPADGRASSRSCSGARPTRCPIAARATPACSVSRGGFSTALLHARPSRRSATGTKPPAVHPVDGERAEVVVLFRASTTWKPSASTRPRN